MTSVVVGIDIGTSSCKIVAVSNDGSIVASVSRSYPLYCERSGWSEQEPADWWAAVDSGMPELSNKVLAAGHAIVGLGLSGQMHGLVCLNAAGDVLRRAILWNDQRSAQECDDITTSVGGIDVVVKLINNQLFPAVTAGKVLWVKRNEPAIFDQLALVLNPKDFIRYRMTGLAFTDVSEASGTGLFDVRTKTWSTPLVEACGLRAQQLPAIVESTAVTGVVSPERALSWGIPLDTPVYGGGGDSVIQTTSMGILRAGDVGVTLGTAGVIAAATEFCPDNEGGRLQVSANNAPGLWHVMGVSLSAAGAFQWLGDIVEQFKNVDGKVTEPDFTALSALAAQSPRGAHEILFLPYLSGERAPHLAPHASAVWIGLQRQHVAADLARSVVEGVLLNMRLTLEILEKAGVPCKRLILSGGATKSEFWRQLVADVFGREAVTFTGSAEGGAYGAALAAGVGQGMWDVYEDAFQQMAVQEEIHPDPVAARHYDKIFDVHKALFGQMAASYQDLERLKAAVSNDS